MQCLDDVINLNGFSEDVSLAIEKAVKPTILTKDDSMADNGIVAVIRGVSTIIWNNVIKKVSFTLASSLSICAAPKSTLAPSLNGFNVGLPLKTYLA
jgi:hypothetical protein